MIMKQIPSINFTDDHSFFQFDQKIVANEVIWPKYNLVRLHVH